MNSVTNKMLFALCMTSYANRKHLIRITDALIIRFVCIYPLLGKEVLSRVVWVNPYTFRRVFIF